MPHAPITYKNGYSFSRECFSSSWLRLVRMRIDSLSMRTRKCEHIINLNALDHGQSILTQVIYCVSHSIITCFLSGVWPAFTHLHAALLVKPWLVVSRLLLLLTRRGRQGEVPPHSFQRSSGLLQPWTSCRMYTFTSVVTIPIFCLHWSWVK